MGSTSRAVEGFTQLSIDRVPKRVTLLGEHFEFSCTTANSQTPGKEIVMSRASPAPRRKFLRQAGVVASGALAAPMLARSEGTTSLRFQST